MARKKQKISVEKFIAVWMKHQRKAGSRAEIAKELGVKVGSVSARKEKLRSVGVKLPHLNKGSDMAERARKALAAETKKRSR